MTPAALTPAALRVLDLAAWLPLVPADLAVRLVAGGHRLPALLDHGLLEAAEIALGYGPRRRLFCPTATGAEALAYLRGVAPAALAVERRLRAPAVRAALRSLPAVLAAYELLAWTRPAGGELVAWRRPYRLAVPDPWSGATRTVRLPAGAVWRTDGVEVACLLWPDLAQVPVEAAALALGRLVRAWARVPDATPPLVVATTTEPRARAWRALAEATWRMLPEGPLPVQVVTWAEIRTGQALVWHWAGMGQAAPRAPTPPAPSPSRVAVGLPATRAAWGAAGLAPVERELLDVLARHPFPSVARVAVLMGWGERWAGSVCRRLAARGLLRWEPNGHSDILARAPLVECTRAGLRLAAWWRGLSLAEAVRFHGFAGGGPGDPVGDRDSLVRHLAHTVGADGAFLAFVQAAAREQGRGGDDALVEWRNAAASAHGRLRPDGYGVYRRRRRLWGFFLEYDRGTENLRDLRHKFAGYYTTIERGRVLPEYDGLPLVLTVTTEPGQEERIARAVREASVGRLAPLRVLITTEARLAADGPLATIWRTPDAPLRRHWPGGVA